MIEICSLVMFFIYIFWKNFLYVFVDVKLFNCNLVNVRIDLYISYILY